MNILHFPQEILVHILAFLDLGDILTCERTCRLLHQIYQQSPTLQYIVDTTIGGVIDTGNSPLVVAERLEHLRMRTDAWNQLKINCTTQIPITYSPSGIYDLTGGYYFLGETPHPTLRWITASMRYVSLPSIYSHLRGRAPQWMKLEVGESIIDIGVCAEENDLIAVVTASDIQRDNTFDSNTIRIHLRQISTGHSHSEAQTPIIPIFNAPKAFKRAAIMIEIVGDILAFLIVYPASDVDVPDTFYLIDWKRGIKLAYFSARWRSYTSFVFLSHNVLLFPNLRTHTFDIFRVPHKTGSSRTVPTLSISMKQLEILPILKPVVCLFLPETSQNARIIRMSCRAEPNPIAPSSKYLSNRPFVEAPEETIVIFNMSFHDANPFTRQAIYSCTCIAHRHALLSLLPPDEYIVQHFETISRLPSPFCPLEHETSQSPPSSPSALSNDSMPSLAENSDEEDAEEYCHIHGLSWYEWNGPNVTRWFDSAEVPFRWITTTCGSRYVELGGENDQDRARGRHLRVLDFGTYRIRRAVHAIEKLQESPVDLSLHHDDATPELWHIPQTATIYRTYEQWPLNVTQKDSPSTLKPGSKSSLGPGEACLVVGDSVLQTSVFAGGALTSSLPYIATVSKERYTFDYALIDEERIIGLNVRVCHSVD